MAYKLSVYVVLFLLFFNGSAILLDASGTTEHLGIETSTDNGDEVVAASEDARTFEVGGGLGQTLFGLYAALGGVLEGLFNAVNPGAAMLKSTFVPDYLVNFVFLGLHLLPAIDIVKFLRSG
jgi:hypothetical protein